MRMPAFPVLLLAAGALCVTARLAPAQKNYIVDASGGAGSHFRSIHDAILAASDGDVLSVRPGVYSPFLLRRNLSILGDPGAIVRIPVSGTGTWIDRISATARIHGLRFEALGKNWFTPMIHVSNCTGRVLISEIKTGDHALAPTQGVLVEYSAGVSIDRSDVQQPLGVVDSTLTAVDTQFMNHASAATCVTARNSRIVFSRCGATATWRTTSVAIWLLNSTCELSGDQTRGYFGSGASAPVVGDVNSTLLHDPDVPSSKPLASGLGKVTSQDLPWLQGTGGRIGGAVDLKLGSSPGDAYRIFVGLAGKRWFVAGLGDVWIDPTAFLEFASGSQPASGASMFQRQIPISPGLLGLPIGYQALNQNAMTGLTLSNAVSFVLR